MAHAATKSIGVIMGRERERDAVCAILVQAGMTCHAAPDADAGLALIEQHRPQVVLCDWSRQPLSRERRSPTRTERANDTAPAHEIDALALCQQVRNNAERATTYFVALASRRGRQARTMALEGGVDDYLAKPIDPRELVARVRVGLRLADMQDRLFTASITDGLTGLCNHDHFNRLLEGELSRSRRYGQPLSLLLLDLDYFKAVNDSFGHLVGNQVLEAVAKVLVGSVRTVDTVARYGGEEFAIIAPQSPMSEALVLARRILTALPRQVRLPALREHRITASVGVAGADDLRVKNAADLVDLADKALYIAKHRGRDQLASVSDVHFEGDVAGLIQIEDVDALRKRVAVMSVQAKEAYVQSISSLVQAMEEKDPYTARHSLNVSYYAEQLAFEFGCNEAFVQSVRNAALLHDIGKVGIPDRILMKPSRLTGIEQSVIDQVPYISTRIVEPLRILETEIQIIRHQREYYDGSGIPSGLAGEQIPLGSRILLVADAFDAMTSDRVYRPQCSVDDALDELTRLSGRQFDPQIVAILRQIITAEPAVAGEWQRRINETREAFAAPVEVS